MTPNDSPELPSLQILLVEDQRVFLRHMTEVLESLEGIARIHPATTLEEARQILEQEMINVAFIDLQLSEDKRNRDGLTLIQEIRGRYQTVPIVVSGSPQHEDVRDALKLGAEDYVLKAEFEQRIPIILKNLRRNMVQTQELHDFRARGAVDPTQSILGTSVAIQNLRALIRKCAVVESSEPVTVLVLGPTGSGKELVAQAIHKLGPHPSADFFDLNCGAIPEDLIESQLFGHVQGAFTGAIREQPGYLTQVGLGTLFLDEIGELSLSLQTRLLRVLENRSFRPVGSTNKQLQFKGRIVAATHVDLKEQVREKRFREDLYHRLNVLTIRVPPLSEHREDIPTLIQHFLTTRHRKPLHFTPEAMDLLCQRPWPGNARELRNAVDRLAYLADDGKVDAQAIARYLPPDLDIISGEGLLDLMAQQILTLPVGDRIEAITKALVQEAMKQAGGNISEAARRLERGRKRVERFLNRPPRDPQEPLPDD